MFFFASEGTLCEVNRTYRFIRAYNPNRVIGFPKRLRNMGLDSGRPLARWSSSSIVFLHSGQDRILRPFPITFTYPVPALSHVRLSLQMFNISPARAPEL